jgi:DNA gyrase/topoisomerase IV subunit B
VNSLARKTKALKEGEPNLAGDYIREGLGAVVSVKVSRGGRCRSGGGWLVRF